MGIESHWGIAVGGINVHTQRHCKNELASDGIKRPKYPLS